MISATAAQEAAQQAPRPTDAGIAPNAENAPSGVFNTAQDAQEAKPTQTVADIYANRATKRADTVIDTSPEGHTLAQQLVSC